MSSALKVKGVRLYYLILKLPSKKLPPFLRQLGDTYVKEEFRLNKNNKDDQYKEFLYQWNKYYEDLAGTKNPYEIGSNMNEEDKKLLNEEQLENLEKLKTVAKTNNNRR